MIVPLCFGVQVPVPHIVCWLTGTCQWNRAIDKVISYTCADVATTSSNVCCEMGQQTSFQGWKTYQTDCECTHNILCGKKQETKTASKCKKEMENVQMSALPD